MSAKTFSSPRAHPASGMIAAVELYGFADWLQARPIVTAQLSPRAARQLAIELLKSADVIEGARR